MIQISSDQTELPKLEEEVKKELDAYNRWYTSTFPGSQPLTKFEALTLQTYLVARLSRKFPG